MEYSILLSKIHCTKRSNVVKRSRLVELDVLTILYLSNPSIVAIAIVLSYDEGSAKLAS